MDSSKLPAGRLLAYAGLALPLSIAELPILIYLPAFYAKELGLNIGLVGLVFLLARCWDGISDPLIAWYSDHSNSRFGRRKPWVMVGGPLLMAATWFLCNPPENAGLVYLGIWALLFYTSFTIIRIPYVSWGSEMTSNYEGRNRVTAFRDGGFMVGNLLVSAAPLLLLPKGAPVGDVLFLITLMIVVLIPLTLSPLSLFVADTPHCQRLRVPFFQGLKILLQNGPMIRFLIAFGFVFVALGVLNSLVLFVLEDGFDLPGIFLSLFFIQYIVAVLMVPVVVQLANHFGKHITLTGGLALMLVTLLCASIAPMGNYPIVAFITGVFGISFSCLYVLPFSILADIIDYDEVKTGEERAGIYVAAYGLISKGGLALGVGVAFGFLGLMGYDPNAEVKGFYEVVVLRIATYGLTSLLLIPAIVLLWRFPIDKKRQKELRKVINARRSNDSNGADQEDGMPNGYVLIPAIKTGD